MVIRRRMSGRETATLSVAFACLRQDRAVLDVLRWWVIAKARGEQSPRNKGDAEALADRIRGEIRLGTFRGSEPARADTTARSRLHS